jgi:RNase P/RNase MRP subunit p29
LYGIEGVIISETEDVIIWELTDGQQYIINRNDNSISITPLGGNYSIAPLGLVSGEYLLSNEENLNDRINERDNFICPLSCP